jgi:hypothetical protein
MNLHPNLKKTYTKEQLSARDAQQKAEFIAFGPIVFEVSRLMIKLGILEMLRDAELTIDDIAERTTLSRYAVKCLLEASLTIGTVLVNEETNKFTISKTGWFLLNDPATRVNIDFNHDVNYEGMFHLEEALKSGCPAGLKHFGSWPTVYEGLSSLPKNIQKSWFAFDHFYSDSSFKDALNIVFADKPKTLLDVGGNTGRWALQCVQYDTDVEVTIMDLPQQLDMMREQVKTKQGADRIQGLGTNLLDRTNEFPHQQHYDAIWMSQFLDCFSEDEILSILERTAKIMDSNTTLYIMETLWDRQKYEPAAFCLTQISLYFTDIANGNSKMYSSEDLIHLIKETGLSVIKTYDHLGQGHSILVIKK